MLNYNLNLNASLRNEEKNNEDVRPEIYWNYSYRTISGFIQMCGRPIRSVDDYADTIIIDSNFGDLLRYSGHLFPRWFLDSIKKVEIKQKVK